MKTINDGSLGINADSCAGCHRAHTASGPFIINAADEESMCLTCHSAGATGASTDVMTGVQYTVAGGTTQLGALRGGGFDEARINSGSVARLSYLRNAVDVSQRPKVPVRTTPAPVTSAHLALAENGLVNPGIAWGNGAAGTGAGPAVELSCASCHNPHGNGQFRILNKIPESDGADFDDAWVVDVLSSTAATDRITTVISHALQVGDVVTIAGTGTAADGANRTVATVSANYFTLTGVDILADTTGGTVSRTSGVTVTDASLPAAGDARNYTVMQVKGTEGTESTYLLYRSQVAAAAIAGTFNGIAGAYGPFGGDYFARNVPWNPQINNPACVPTTFPAPAECATANSAPNGRPSTFSGQITAWCSSCHTRYFANNNPVEDPPTATTGAAWANPRPGDDLYKYQHRTVPGRDCLTCHVSHGSNAAMTGTYSSTFDYPDGTASASSRLLKIDNRGTCQACHDPTGTIAAGTYIGPANPRVP